MDLIFHTRHLSKLINSQCLLNPSEHLFIELFKTEPNEKNTISEEQVCVMSTQRESNETQVWAVHDNDPSSSTETESHQQREQEDRITSCQVHKMADVTFRQEQWHLGTVPNGGKHVRNMPMTAYAYISHHGDTFFTAFFYPFVHQTKSLSSTS